MKRSWRKNSQHIEQDFELNIAAIIDCFVVLISFLLISTSFVAIGIIDAEVGAAGDEHIEDALLAAAIQVTINLKSDQTIEVHVRGDVTRDYVLSPNVKLGIKQWNHEKLIDHLALLKGEWPKLQSAVLLADNTVAYQDVIKSMEVAHTAIPHIALGGYE